MRPDVVLQGNQQINFDLKEKEANDLIGNSNCPQILLVRCWECKCFIVLWFAAVQPKNTDGKDEKPSDGSMQHCTENQKCDKIHFKMISTKVPMTRALKIHKDIVKDHRSPVQK